MASENRPLVRNAGRFALAASIVATLLTAFVVTAKSRPDKSPHAVRPVWEEEPLGI
jgi:hypothetical protein